ncbi:MAG: FAD-dependent oxidoreductase [Proteobacteria bacterium]|nr:FAD-dependent oxidoreductase [Pseudomonadota bacterium]
MSRARRDVIVVGGGPAGSTAAALLAEAGHDVLLLERERFPRFHVGESLLPIDIPLLERLGVRLAEGPYRYKRGADFLDEQTGDFARYNFADGLDGTPDHAFQVERSLFDAALLDAARTRGADVRMAEPVRSVAVAPEVVRVESAGGVHEARYLVDASGQSALLAKQWGGVAPIPEFGRAAAFRHYRGVAPQVADELGREGNIQVLMLPDGWAWVIPLHGDTVSIGVVRRRALRPEELDREVADSPHLSRITAGARPGDAHRISNFSYRNTEPSGARYCCVGDAACFLDPVFSSGVALAMLGAETAVGLLSPALAARSEDEPSLMKPWRGHMDVIYRSFSALIHRFYHTRMIDNLFFAERPDPAIRRGLITVLSGDVWRDDNPFQQLLERSRRGERLDRSQAR